MSETEFMKAAFALVEEMKARDLREAIDIMHKENPAIYNKSYMARKAKVLIATPTRGSDFTFRYVASLFNTIFSLNHKYEFSFITLVSTLIHVTRNQLAQNNWPEFILFIDSDMAWVPCDLITAIESDRDIVTGIYYNRRPPFSMEIYKKEHKTERYESFYYIHDKPFQCDACGFGFVLIKRKVIKAMLEKAKVDPAFGFPFDPIVSKAHKTVDSKWEDEDISFCIRAREMGYEIWADPRISLGHHISPFSVHKDNVAELRQFFQRTKMM